MPPPSLELHPCVRCSHTLVGGISGGRCPECGAPFLPVPPVLPSGAWSHPRARRRFERGSALFLAIVPSSLPGILVASQVRFAPMPTFWLAAVPPLACAVVAALLLDLGRPLPPVSRHRLGTTSILAVLPLLALACFAIAAREDAARELGVPLGLATTSIFAAASGAVAWHRRRLVSTTHSASAALGITTTAIMLATVALSLGLGGADDVERTLAVAGCMAVSVPLSLLLVGTSLYRTSSLVHRRFAQAA